jgi:hypothetical protein
MVIILSISSNIAVYSAAFAGNIRVYKASIIIRQRKLKPFSMPAALLYVSFKGRMFVFKNVSNMDDRMFHDKCWYMIRTSSSEFLADVWVNKKYLGVTYPEHIEKLLH